MASPGETALIRALGWQQQSQEVIANNLANVSSSGFKRSQLISEAVHSPFADVLDDAFAPNGRIGSRKEIDITAGDLQPTGDNTQIAIDGPGFLTERGPDGRVTLSRGGQLTVDANGILRSQTTGGAILSATGTELQVDAEASTLRVAPDGALRIQTRDGELEVGRIGLFEVDRDTSLQPISGGRYALPGGAPPPRAAANGETSIRQGYLEQSNVDSLTELVRMIAVQRGFQGQSRALTTLQRMQGEYANQFDR